MHEGPRRVNTSTTVQIVTQQTTEATAESM
jgi:hypothetical protein